MAANYFDTFFDALTELDELADLADMDGTLGRCQAHHRFPIHTPSAPLQILKHPYRCLQANGIAESMDVMIGFERIGD